MAEEKGPWFQIASMLLAALLMGLVAALAVTPLAIVAWILFR